MPTPCQPLGGDGAADGSSERSKGWGLPQAPASPLGCLFLGAPGPQGRLFGGHKVLLLAHVEAQCEEVPEIGQRANPEHE